MYDVLAPYDRVGLEFCTLQLIKTMVPAQLGQHIKPVEIGRVAAFLQSDNANIIRGQSINADGGDTPY